MFIQRVTGNTKYMIFVNVILLYIYLLYTKREQKSLPKGDMFYMYKILYFINDHILHRHKI